MGLYEDTGARYDNIKGISWENLTKYAQHRYGMDKPSDGKIPKSMKYDWITSPTNTLFSLGFDEFFRLEHFEMVDDLGSEPDDPTEEVRPITYEDTDFAIVGVTREMSFEEAHGTFRDKIKGFREVFSSSLRHTETQGAGELVKAWNNIGNFYRDKAKEAYRQQLSSSGNLSR